MPQINRPIPPPPGARFVRRVPEGDTTERYVCGDCGHIYYTNPKIVVGAVVTYGGRILLCRRAIEPRRGFWTLPAGYLEEHETPEDGARREAREEALCDIVLDGLLAVYSIVRLSQVQLIYRAHLDAENFGAGAESLDVTLFSWDDIPWTEIAFPSVHWGAPSLARNKGYAGVRAVLQSTRAGRKLHRTLNVRKAVTPKFRRLSCRPACA